MKYYTIQGVNIITAENEAALTRFYKNVLPLPVDYEEGKYIVEEGMLVLNPNWEEELEDAERIRIANLHMTRGDVFRGLLLAKGFTRSDIRGLIELMPEETPEQRVSKEMALIDFDEALEFYRGVALIDTLGNALEISPEQMNRFFDTKDWKELLK